MEEKAAQQQRQLRGRGRGRKWVVEKRWLEFFSDPSQWWDNRSEKSELNANYPDFKHKKTEEALWLNGKCKPPWVEAKLAALAPGSVPLHIFSWNAKLTRYVKDGQYEKVLELFQQMQQQGIVPDPFTFFRVLSACASLQALEEGRRIHSQIIQSGNCESDAFVGSSLVAMYVKCGSMEDAERVFSTMPTRNALSWSAMILGYMKSGHGHKALALYRQMLQEGVEPEPVTFVRVLNVCASLAALDEGRRVHKHIIQSGCESDIFVGSSLVDMYTKCGSIRDAQQVFDGMPVRNVVSWTAIILGHVKCGQGQKALALFQQMQQEGVEPDPITFVGVLNACAYLTAIEEGRLIHEWISQSGFESDVFVGNSLVDMYAKCGSMEEARAVFDKMPARNVVSWTAMILGHVKCGQGDKALELFQKMQQEGTQPDLVTFVAVVNACANVGSLDEGRHVHKQIVQFGFESDVFVGSSLIDMYVKCGSIEDAQEVFNKMPIRDVVTWSAMILGHVKCGQGQKALALYRQMQHNGVQPDNVTFMGVLNACAIVAALEEGRAVHKQIVQNGWESNLFVGNCLIDMYGKCGSLEEATRVFNTMHTRNVVSWTAMLQGYAMHGHAKEALELFERMCAEGVEINSITLGALLSACSHAGLINEGLCYFDSMGFVYNISATLEHCSCMVDLLGRAGHLQDAEDFINQMSCEPDAAVWRTLLGACRIHDNVEMGEHVAKRVLELDPGNAADYVVLLPNINTAAVKWDLSTHMQQRIKAPGFK